MGKLSLRDSINIIILVLLTFGMSFGVSQYTAKKEIMNICDNKATQDLNYMLKFIDKELSQAEQAAKTFSAAVFERTDAIPDSAQLFALQEHFLEVNPNISSILIGYEERAYPDYVTSKNGYGLMTVSTPNGPQQYQLDDNTEFRKHDWYSIAIHKAQRRWSKPFISPTTLAPITTYSQPIYTKHGHLLGVIGINLKLSRLDSLMNCVKPYPNARYTALLNNDLTYILHPVKDFVLNMDLRTEHESVGDVIDDQLLIKLGSRQSGKEHVHWDGRDQTIYYAPVEKAECSVMLILDDETTRKFVAPNIALRVILSSVGLLLIIIYLLLLVRKGKKQTKAAQP